jgi:phosphate starvation-inducible PhoH-like protein
LPEPSKSGLIEASKVLKGIEGIGIIKLNEKDVVRHKLVQDIVKAYDKYYEDRRR